MADDLYYGSPTFFNDDVTFYGDVNVYGAYKDNLYDGRPYLGIQRT